MKYIPILFNTEMVQAILSGKKTQTRRIIKQLCDSKARIDGLPPNGFDFFISPSTGFLYWKDIGRQVTMNEKPIRAPYMPGDVLWVRETWSTHYDGIHPELVYCYKADGINLEAECLPGESNRWYPSIHMPRDAARIFLRVTDVRTEMLVTIRDEDAIAEGANCKNGKNIGIEEKMRRSAVERFANIWDSTIKRADYDSLSFSANPWVWVVTFERCDKPEGW